MILRFTTLLDWVEGRLAQTEAEQVVEALQADPQAQETVAWIREFHAVAAAGLMQKPPAELSDSLKSLFSKVHDASGPRAHGRISQDTRELRLAGMRSPSAQLQGYEHVVLSGESVRFLLTLVSRHGNMVDIRGNAEAETPDCPVPSGEVVFLDPAAPPRLARLAADGSFELTKVSRGVSEMWFLGESTQFRCALSLERR